MSIPTGNCSPPPASVYLAPIRLNYPTADEALNSVLGAVAGNYDVRTRHYILDGRQSRPTMLIQPAAGEPFN